MQEIFRLPAEEEGDGEAHASFHIGKETLASWEAKMTSWLQRSPRAGTGCLACCVMTGWGRERVLPLAQEPKILWWRVLLNCIILWKGHSKAKDIGNPFPCHRASEGQAGTFS